MYFINNKCENIKIKRYIFNYMFFNKNWKFIIKLNEFEFWKSLENNLKKCILPIFYSIILLILDKLIHTINK
jgi:hypothetical protein